MISEADYQEIKRRIKLDLKTSLTTGGLYDDTPSLVADVPLELPKPLLPIGQQLIGGLDARIYGILPLGTQQFYIKLDLDVASLRITMITADWIINNDLIASTFRQPTKDDFVGRYKNGPDFWYGPVGTSNETLTINKVMDAGTIVYITVINRSNVSGKFKLYWNAQ